MTKSIFAVLNGIERLRKQSLGRKRQLSKAVTKFQLLLTQLSTLKKAGLRARQHKNSFPRFASTKDFGSEKSSRQSFRLRGRNIFFLKHHQIKKIFLRFARDPRKLDQDYFFRLVGSKKKLTALQNLIFFCFCFMLRGRMSQGLGSEAQVEILKVENSQGSKALVLF